MMLYLEVTRYRGLVPEQPASLSVNSGVCTLGRNPDNDLALGDPDRLVSGCHAQIEIRSDGVWIIDRSTNGTFINQSSERLPSSQPVELHDGDTLSIGPYEIAVAIESDPGGAATDRFAPGPFAPTSFPEGQASLPGMAGPGPAPDIMDLLGGSGGQPSGKDQGPALDPFADARPLDPFLAAPAPQDEGPRAAEPRLTPVEHVFFRPPESQPIPEDYDLLQDALVTPVPAPVVPGPESLPPARAELPRTPPADTGPPPDWGLDPWLEPDQGPAGPGQPLPGSPAPADLGTAPGEGVEMARVSAPESQAAAPEAARRSQQSAVSAPVEATPESLVQPGPAPRQGDLLTAFMAGLGTGDPNEVKDPAALLQGAGALLRALTTGLTTTMMARAQFKSELRLGVTTIRRTENNPFKFSVSPEEALERLLLRPNPAYLPPLEAARGAFEDIQAHEMAMIAGLRAALRALLARFEPSALEARLDAATGLDRLLPMARKSRYWDLFNETYGQVAADAAEDFMQLFGEAFTRAYEDQIRRLSQAWGPRGPLGGRGIAATDGS